jgi:periplasmic protein TonB
MGFAGTLAIHAGAVLALLLSVATAPKASPPTYAVELVASAPRTGTARPAPEARSNPITPPAPKARPKPAQVKQTSPAASKPTTAKTASPVTPLPGETPSGGSDIANVDLKGKAFPYPEYLRNLVTQIYRRWNRPVGNASLTAEIGFVILRDGTVKEITKVNGSGSYSFDLEARGAVEAAALAKAFGPLPAGYPADYLQISFLFTPRRAP